jgi:hypothetical protein
VLLQLRQPRLREVLVAGDELPVRDQDWGHPVRETRVEGVQSLAVRVPVSADVDRLHLPNLVERVVDQEGPSSTLPAPIRGSSGADNHLEDQVRREHTQHAKGDRCQVLLVVGVSDR